MTIDKAPAFFRRSVLKFAVFGGVSSVVASSASSQRSRSEGAAPSTAPAMPSATGETEVPVWDGTHESPHASDYIIDSLRAMGIDYVAAMSGSSFDGLQESVINHGMLQQPPLNWITAVHEDSSVAICHGYYKAAGKPMACMMHSTVGLQHAVMAIYNAWCDRVPIIMLTASHADAGRRRSGWDWLHSVNDGALLVRDITKWDDAPLSLRAFAGSLPRAMKLAMTPPHGPILLVVDAGLQHGSVDKGSLPDLPSLPATSAPQAEQGRLQQVASALVEATYPVIVADRVARTPRGMEQLVTLAELLQAAVIDLGGRMNFPWRHPLNQSGSKDVALARADVVLAMELTDPLSVFYRFDGTASPRPIQQDGARKIVLGANELLSRANYQDFGPYAPADIVLPGDAEASLPALIAAVRARLSAGPDSVDRPARGAQLRAAHEHILARDQATAALGLDDQPISVARMCAEVYDAIKGEDWCLATGTLFQSSWPQRLWDGRKHHNYLGESGGYGVGYAGPASLGAALANHGTGRFTLAVLGDGDLLMGDGVLWTAAHENIPILWVVHNNRGWKQEEMILQVTAGQRDRGAGRSHIGTTLTNPEIDFKKLANSMGVYAEGPITDPRKLGAALERAVAVVKSGKPALVDVVSQAR